MQRPGSVEVAALSAHFDEVAHRGPDLDSHVTPKRDRENRFTRDPKTFSGSGDV